MQNQLTARLLPFINLPPSPIHHLHYNPVSHHLLITRKHYSEVYQVSTTPDPHSTHLEPLMVMEPCQQVYQIEGMVVMVMGYELRVWAGAHWKAYPFTTQVVASSTVLDAEDGVLYTFHVGEARRWRVSREYGVEVRHLGKHELPYHVTSEGALEGYGKKVKPPNAKAHKFTVVKQSKLGYLFVGTDKGHLHIYETKYLTHVKTFHRHEAAILTIFTHDNVCYFSGSDSRISSLVYTTSGDTGAWVLSKQVRAQSHDVLALEYIENEGSGLLASGGLTTDVCLHGLEEGGVLGAEWAHRVGYRADRVTESVGGFVVVNKYAGFEIWKMAEEREQVQLLVKYDMPFYKHITKILAREQSEHVMLFVVTQQESTLWSFTEEQGLTKMLTVKNSYNTAVWYKRDCLLTIRDGSKLQLLNLKTGNIREIGQTQVSFVTDLKVGYGKQGRIVVGSRLTGEIEVFRLSIQNLVKLTGKFTLQGPYNVLDFCYYNPDHLIIKQAQSQMINEFTKNGEVVGEVVKLPVKKVRDFGWLTVRSGHKAKSLWYAVSQGKIVVVSKMKKQAGNRKVRVKQMPRIANVVVNSVQPKREVEAEQQQELKVDWNFGVIPLDLTKMIAEEIQPVLVKKIL